MEQFYWNGVHGNGWRFLAIAVSTVWLLVLGGLAALAISFSCDRTPPKRLMSAHHPGSNLEAVLFRYSGGPTVDFRYDIVIGKRGGPSGTTVYRVTDVSDEGDIRFYWADERTLKVRVGGMVRTIWSDPVVEITIDGAPVRAEFMRIYPDRGASVKGAGGARGESKRR